MASLSSSAFDFGTDRDREHRLGVHERLDVDVGAPHREHVAGGGAAQLRDRGEVAGHDAIGGFLLLAPHRDELVQALVGDGATVHRGPRRVRPSPAGP